MKRSLSVIFSTVFSGAGLGLLIWTLIASTMPQHIRMDAATFYKVVAIALLLTTAGLVSSTLQLANKKNFLYALTGWKTSWLSREVVFALLLYPLIAMHLWVIHSSYSALAPFTLLKVIACALAILFCTGMSYGSLKTGQRWSAWMTPAKFILFGLASGAVLFTAALSLRPVEVGPLGRPMMALVFLALSLALYLACLLTHRRTALSSKDALGVKTGHEHVSNAGHSPSTNLTHELGFQLSKDHFYVLRSLVIIWAFIIPFVLLAYSRWYWVASVFCIAGLLVERWLFFAEAEHIVELLQSKSSQP